MKPTAVVFGLVLVSTVFGQNLFSPAEAWAKKPSAKKQKNRAAASAAITPPVDPHIKSVIEAVSIAGEVATLGSRWAHGDGEVPSGKSKEAKLAAAKHASVNGDGESCLKTISSVWSKAATVQPWIVVLELTCASQVLQAKPSQASSDQLYKAVSKVEKNPTWLLHGPHVESLRSALCKAYLASLEQDLKTNRLRALQSVERLEELSAFTDEAMRAKMWRFAGELALMARDALGARELFKRSLSEEDSPETRARLAVAEGAIKTTSPEISSTPGKIVGEPKATASPSPELEASKLEIELVERATAALKAGDLVAAVDDLTRLIREFPGGTRGKWASDRVMEAYLSIADKNELKLTFSKAQILRKMESVDGDRLSEWAKQLYSRGQWAEAAALASLALDKAEGARLVSALDLAGKAALANDQFAQARKYFDRLILVAAGTQAAREALFRSGLLRFRQKEFNQAVSDFERLLATAQIGQLELPARYWLWRSLQKSNPERANDAADELLRKYPFSYYGLRARLERTSNVLEWKVENGKFNAKFFLTSQQRRAWERAQLLLKAGWLDEAQAEIQVLPIAKKAEDKAVRALLWAAAGQYVKATKLANEAWDEVPELRKPPLVQAAFPKDFTSLIDSQADLRKLDRDLVRGLVKQESSFNPRAVSTSNAYGLMQIIGPTAREIAQDLKVSPFTLPDDMFHASRNVQFGTFYLAKLLQKYSGHVPLALAAYNAGPARIDRWLKGRGTLQNLSALRSSAPEDELWFDELPYAETSGYVKAILRNLLIYKMLDNGRVQVSEPIWAINGEKL